MFFFFSRKRLFWSCYFISSENFFDTKKMDIEEYDREGRVLIHEHADFFLVNCYFPNSQRDHKRLPYKLNFCHQILSKLKKLQKKKVSSSLVISIFPTKKLICQS